MNRDPLAWTPDELEQLRPLDQPEKVQAFLDALPYNDDKLSRSPRRTLRDRKAHCMEGALLAAAALEQHGFGAQVLDLSAVRDDDHVIALYRQHGCWGAVAKSNFPTLRFREPIHRTLRELALSYFDGYFNVLGERTLRGFSRPVDLRRFDAMHWRTTEVDLDEPIGNYLTARPHQALLTEAMVQSLRPVDDRTLQAALAGANPAGLYQVEPG